MKHTKLTAREKELFKGIKLKSLDASYPVGVRYAITSVSNAYV